MMEFQIPSAQAWRFATSYKHWTFEPYVKRESIGKILRSENVHDTSQVEWTIFD